MSKIVYTIGSNFQVGGGGQVGKESLFEVKIFVEENVSKKG